MKFLLIVVILGAIYFICAKRNQPQPATSAGSAEVAQPAAQRLPNHGTDSNYFKRPLDRTHEVLDQAKKNKESNSF